MRKRGNRKTHFSSVKMVMVVMINLRQIGGVNCLSQTENLKSRFYLSTMTCWQLMIKLDWQEREDLRVGKSIGEY